MAPVPAARSTSEPPAQKWLMATSAKSVSPQFGRSVPKIAHAMCSQIGRRWCSTRTEMCTDTHSRVFDFMGAHECTRHERIGCENGGKSLSEQKKFRVLMCCMGNICRSPTAEGVLRHKLRAAGLHELVVVDSA